MGGILPFAAVLRTAASVKKCPLYCQRRKARTDLKNVFLSLCHRFPLYFLSAVATCLEKEVTTS